MNELAKKIEAVLFVAGEGMSVSRLSLLFKKKEEEILKSLDELEEHLKNGHFLLLLKHEDKVSLTTAPEVSGIVEDFAKEEFAGELTRASLETLAIVAYKGPLKRSEIDYIRGVNSSFMIRNLLMRGLVERIKDPKDSRAFLYKISSDFLKFLGLSSVSQLPDFGALGERLENFIKEGEAPTNDETK